MLLLSDVWGSVVARELGALEGGSAAAAAAREVLEAGC